MSPTHLPWTFLELHDYWLAAGQNELTGILEIEANRVLSDYLAAHPEQSIPPVPIDDILQSYGVRLEFVDLDRGVLGMLVVTSDTPPLVIVSDQLDWVVYPRRIGEYTMTIAHEIGHFVLHRMPPPEHGEHENHAEAEPLSEAQPLCRTAAKRRGREQFERGGVHYWNERSMDTFAAFLLMPRDAVLKAWQSILPGVDTVSYPDAGAAAATIYAALLGSAPHESAIPRLDWLVAKKLAQRFEVSVAAMRQQLILFGLLQPNTPRLLRRKGDRLSRMFDSMTREQVEAWSPFLSGF